MLGDQDIKRIPALEFFVWDPKKRRKMTPEDLNLNFIAKLWFENLCHMEVRASVAGSNWQTWLINNMLMCQICLGNIFAWSLDWEIPSFLVFSNWERNALIYSMKNFNSF